MTIIGMRRSLSSRSAREAGSAKSGNWSRPKPEAGPAGGAPP